MKTPILAVGLLVGCGVPDIEIDDSKLIAEPENFRIVREQVAESLGIYPVPTVFYYGPDTAAGDGCLGHNISGGCRNGVTGGNGIWISIWRADLTPSESALVHELTHWKIWDEFHADRGTGKTWGTDPIDDLEPGTRVGDANLSLVARGL